MLSLCLSCIVKDYLSSNATPGFYRSRTDAIEHELALYEWSGGFLEGSGEVKFEGRWCWA